MWVIKKPEGSPPQQLGLFNVVPEKKVVDRKTIRQNPMMYEDPYFRMAGNHNVVTYDGFKETIYKLNFKLKVYPIPGNSFGYVQRSIVILYYNNFRLLKN